MYSNSTKALTFVGVKVRVTLRAITYSTSAQYHTAGKSSVKS